MTIKFSMEPEKPKEIDPYLLIIFSHPGKGKTTAFSLLPNNLILDLQHGAPEIGGIYQDASSYDKLLEIRNELEKQNVKYDFITIDTTTELEEYSEILAAQLYQDTPMGKKWGRKRTNGDPNGELDDEGSIPIEENNIKKLPNGAGYGYIREAFQRIIRGFMPFAKHGIILSGHMKDRLIDDTSKRLDTAKLDLTGKLGRIMASKANAVAYGYREGNKFILTFHSDDLVVKTRCKFLREHDIALTEKDSETEIFTHHWDLIYPNYFKQKGETNENI